MQKRRLAAGALACVIATGWAAPASPPSPPSRWADYLAGVRKAESIVDDEARCLAMPDLPGNAWRPGAAKWRCTTLRKPMLSLDQIDALLQRDDGAAELERRFAGLLDANYKDLQQRDQIFIAFNPFDESQRAGDIAARWLKQSPSSAFAKAALAHHHERAGWVARGKKLVRDTPQPQLDRMMKEFDGAVPLYLEALKSEPRLSPACMGLAAIGRQASTELETAAMAACTNVDSDSYFVALERIYEAQPNWGGSDEALRAAVAYAAARVDRNPMLAALLADHAGYAPSIADEPASVADELVAAVRMAPNGSLSGRAGVAYRHSGDNWTALAYLSQAVRFKPRDAVSRFNRGDLLRDMGDLEGAYRDMKVAVDVDPDNGWNEYRMGQIARELHDEKEARPYFLRAMDDAERRQSAMRMYCQTFLLDPTSTVQQALDCTRDLVTEFPEGGEGWRLRYWALSKVDDPETAEAARMFLRYVDTSDPVQQGAVAGVEQWLRRGGLSDARYGLGDAKNGYGKDVSIENFRQNTPPLQEKQSAEEEFKQRVAARKTNLDEPLVMLRSDFPAYPADALAEGVEGIVDVKFTVDEKGNVQDLVVLSSPDPRLSKATVDALSRWRFSPPRLHGAPTRIEVRERIPFLLK